MALKITNGEKQGYYKITGFEFDTGIVRLEKYKDQTHRNNGNTQFLHSRNIQIDIEELPVDVKNALISAGYDSLKNLEEFEGAIDV